MRRERGSIFIVSIALVTGMVAILASVAATQRMADQAALNRLELRRARLAAEAGVQRAVAELALAAQAQQATGGTTTAPTTGSSGAATTLQDPWALLGNAGAERFVLGDTSFRLQIVDASSFVNVNAASLEQLQRMPLTQEQIDSLLDWREPGQAPRPYGAKDAYYNSLPDPYNARLAPLESVDELLLIKGFTPTDVYQPPTQQFSNAPLPYLPDGRQAALADIVTVDSYSTQAASQGANRVNVNLQTTTVQTLMTEGGLSPQTAQSIIANRLPIAGTGGGGYADLGQIFVRNPNLAPNELSTILDRLTTSGAQSLSGKINLNTASEAVLSTLPNVTPDVAQAIVQRQSTGFVALSDLLQVPGLNNAQALGGIAGAVTVSSQTFLVRVVGVAGRARVPLEAEIDLRGPAPRIAKIMEPPFPDMEARWGWGTQPASDTVLKEAP